MVVLVILAIVVVKKLASFYRFYKLFDKMSYCKIFNKSKSRFQFLNIIHIFKRPRFFILLAWVSVSHYKVKTIIIRTLTMSKTPKSS